MALSVMAKTTAVSSSAMVGLDRGSHGHRTSAMAISLSSFNTTTTNNVSSISNGSRVHCMKVVNPSTNKRFETLSYLPPQTPESISKQIAYIIKNGWIPCLEFDCSGVVFRENSRIPGYYDGRYWTLWKLPMFGCNDVAPVLGEIEECKATNPKAYIRLLGFDNIKQVQCVAFLVHNPSI